MNWGDTPASQAVLGTSAMNSKTDLNVLSEDELWLRDRYWIFNKTIGSFPILQDLVAKLKPNFSCDICKAEAIPWDKVSPVDSFRKRGCLKRIALDDVLLLLAHGIADGFNVADASGVQNVEGISAGMIILPC